MIIETIAKYSLYIPGLDFANGEFQLLWVVRRIGTHFLPKFDSGEIRYWFNNFGKFVILSLTSIKKACGLIFCYS